MQAWPDLHGAAQVWHGMSQTLVPGHSSEQLVMAGTAGACFIWIAGVAGAAVVDCMHGAGVGAMQVVPLRSGVWLELVVWKLCHWGQCQLP